MMSQQVLGEHISNGRRHVVDKFILGSGDGEPSSHQALPQDLEESRLGEDLFYQRTMIDFVLFI